MLFPGVGTQLDDEQRRRSMVTIKQKLYLLTLNISSTNI